MKKKLIVGLMLLSMAGFSVFAGCKSDEESGSSTPTSSYSLTLNKESVEIDVFQEFYLIAEYNGSEKITWSVSDSSVVSVEDGKLTGLKAGTATVTATAGEYEDVCTVVVADYKAELLRLQAEEPHLSMNKDDVKTMSFSLQYNGKPVSVATQKVFISSDTGVAEVSADGTITAKNYGTAMISVVYTVNQVEVATTVNVSVVSGGSVEIQQRSATIDALASYKGQTFTNAVTLSAKAYEKGVEQTGATIVWSVEEEQDIVSLSGSTLTALNAGTTNVTASYVDKEGVTQTDTITVVVEPVLVESNRSIELSKNKMTGGYAIDLPAVIGEETGALTEAWIASDDIKIDVPCADGVMDFALISAGEKDLCLATRNIIYQVNLELWTATIEAASDMSVLYGATDGWYKLGDDIDMTGATWAYPTAQEFIGKFDGHGYKIENLTLGAFGLFDTLASSAVVSDVTVSAKIPSTATGIGAIATTVKSGANVTIENVSLYVDITGKECGGAIGLVGGKTSMKNVQGVISNGTGDESNGALFGAVAYTPTFEQMKIYSTFKICGQSSKPSAATVMLNQTTGVIVAPTLLTERTNSEFDENDAVTIRCDTGTYVSYTSYANNIRVGAATTGTASLLSVDVANRFGGYVDFLFEKANGEKSYFALPLSSTICVNNETFATYLNTGLTLSGYYELTEDIDLSRYGTWVSTTTLAGTFDGKNHTITGLTTGTNGGLFKQINGGTVKNVAIIDAQLSNKSGVVAANSSGEGATVENVYISLGAQAFSEQQKNYANKCVEMGITDTNVIGISTDWPEFKSGVVFQANDKPVTVRNSVIYMPEYLSTAGGFVTGYAYYGAADVDDCTFIGGNGRITGHWTGREYSENTIGDAVVITDAVTAHTTYKAGWNDMQRAAYNANHPYLELNGANIASTIPTLTNEIVVLAEDIDGETSGLNAMSRGNTTFTGVFDGKGHTISNLTSNYWDRGMLLCRTLKGSVKNLVVKCYWNSWTGGVIADVLDCGYIENVYVEQTVGDTSTPYGVGAIANKLTLGSMKNVVAYTLDGQSTQNNTFSGLFGGCTGATLNAVMENCYYITPYTDVYYVGDQVVMSGTEITTPMDMEKIPQHETFFGIRGFKGETAKADFDAAVSAGTVTLSETLNALIYSTND